MAHSKVREEAREAKSRDIARSLLTSLPASFDEAARQVGFPNPAGLARYLDRKDPSLFLKKYGGALATEDRIMAVYTAFNDTCTREGIKPLARLRMKRD